MPLGGKSFYGKIENAKHPAYYYVEVLPGESGTVNYGGKTFKLDHTDYWPSGWSVTKEDQYEIKGFTFLGGTDVDSSLNNAKFYYTRNTYKVVYINAGSEGNNETEYKYQQDISNAKDFYKPIQPPVGKEGYEFAGWYEDPDGQTKEYNFTGKTMPANNITVYAKWVPKTFTVTVYDADKTKVLKTFPDIPLGDPISADQMPTNVTVPDGSEFLGWVNMDDHKPFNFETKIYQNYELYALVGSKDGYTVTYDANGGTVTAPSDPNKYAAGTQATVLDKGGLTPPAGTDKFFLGWAATQTLTENTELYLPGDTMIIDANITLYAVWGAKPATTTLTYNANYGGANPATKTHALEDGTTALLNNTKVTLYDADQAGFNPPGPGYVLDGWAKTADATKPDYKPGDEVIIDTKDTTAGRNTLYAVWKQLTTTVTVKKVVEGNFGDKTREFHFSYSWTVGENGTPTGSVTFTLTNGHEHRIEDVPIGANLTITETDTDLTNYKTYFSVNSGNKVEPERRTYSFAVSANGDTVVVTNEYEVVPDTGVILDSLPYVLILAVVALGAAGVVIRRRRSREDD